MKNYRITVNGNVYDVEVEELGTGAATQTAAPKAAPKAVAAPKAAAPAAAGSEGAVKVNSPMPGKILSVKASVGQAVKRGEVMILEAMKMENEIVAPSDRTIASINVNEGASVEAGSVLASLN